MKGVSPTTNTLKKLREEGFSPWVTEHWNSFSRKREDLYGCIDVIAIKEGRSGVLGIQCTSKNNMSARLKKIRENPYMDLWIKTGNRLEVWGWFKNKSNRWEVKEMEYNVGE